MTASSAVDEAALDRLVRGTTAVVSRDELSDRLAIAAKEGRPLRIKLGADPSAPDLHLGHTVVLNKLRDFQELGHTVIFLIGDFTARIGDPSGRSEGRRPLDPEEIRRNAATYTDQVFAILDRERTEVRMNSEWMDRMTASDLIRLCGQYTVARILERDDFSARFREQRPIGIHEFLYPLIQGYDSIALRADVEVGGSDQRFNLLVGRELQKSHGMAPQIIMTLPILEGTDGVQKMSKSLGNYVGIRESPDEMFGKIMSISDELMGRWYEILEPHDARAVADQVRSGSLHPREAKARLGARQVAKFHGQSAADLARERFDERFRKHELPESMVRLWEAGESLPPEIVVPALLTKSGLTKSNSEARRLIAQGAVRIDGRVLASERYRTDDDASNRDPVLLVEVGKRRACRVVFSGRAVT
jgi:tyrosyl-tRNA synthetase